MGYHAGQRCPFKGWYRCSVCATEIELDRGESFPPCKCLEGEWILVRPWRKSLEGAL